MNEKTRHKKMKRVIKNALKKDTRKPIVFCAAVPCGSEDTGKLFRVAYYPKTKREAWLMLDIIENSDREPEDNLYLFERLFNDLSQGTVVLGGTKNLLKWAKEEYDIEEDENFVFKGIKPDAIHHRFTATVDEDDLDPCLCTIYCRATYSY